MVQARFLNDTKTVNIVSESVTGNVSVTSENVTGRVSVNPNISHASLTNRDLPDQHPIEAISGLKDALGTYIYEQAQTSSEWTINHNLGKFPSVTVVDSAGNVFFSVVKYINKNTCVVTMNAPMNGVAYLN